MIGRQHNQMLKMMLGAQRRRLFAPLARANFSSQISTTGASSVATTQSGKAVQTLWEYSADAMQKQATKEASEAQYFDELKKFSTEPGAFSKLSETGSSHHLQDIRKKINKIVEQEIALVEFQN